MLQIDDDNCIVIKEKLFVGEFKNNHEDGYNICLQLEFIRNGSKEKGYINIDAGFEKTPELRQFTNREYYGIPFNNDNQYISFEMFDSKRFLDTHIESPIKLRISELSNYKIEVFIELNDDLVKIKYLGRFDALANRL